MGPPVPGFIADGLLAPDTAPDVGYVTGRARKGRGRASPRSSRARGTGRRPTAATTFHRDNPRLVADAIRDVVDAVRAGETALTAP